MKRFFPAILLLLSLLTSCTPITDSAQSTGQQTMTTITVSGTTANSPDPIEPSVTTDPSDEIIPVTTTLVTTAPVTTAPVTTAPVTTAPTVPPPLPEFGDVDLDAIDRDDRTVVYTVEKIFLYHQDGSVLAEIDSGRALISLKQTAEYAVILYKDTVCLTHPHLLSSEAPAEAKHLQDTLGGIYYPGGELLVAIDAGHQRKAMNEKEPLGPGSTQMKAMLSSGTAGVSTRIAERELNLRVALLLRDELISRGYSVVMIRESHDVTLSNAQRAQIANAYDADAFVRIHANGSTNDTVRGAETLCQTPNNPYNGAIYTESRTLAQCILEEYCDQTGLRKRRVIETDTMTGINWSEVPVTIVEMGYMSNAAEDELMATDDFRKSAAVGLADGLDAYFAMDFEN